MCASLVIVLCCLGLFFVRGRFRGSSVGLLSLGTTSGIRASRFRLGFLKIRKGSRSDSVEIVCRSQIRGIGVRGDRVSISEGRKEGSWNLWWSRSGVKLDLGFQGKGKNLIFI